MIEHAKRIGFSRVIRIIPHSTLRSSAVTIGSGRCVSATDTVRSANAVATRFPGHGSVRITSSTSFLDECCPRPLFFRLRNAVFVSRRSLGEAGLPSIKHHLSRRSRGEGGNLEHQTWPRLRPLILSSSFLPLLPSSFGNSPHSRHCEADRFEFRGERLCLLGCEFH